MPCESPSEYYATPPRSASDAPLFADDRPRQISARQYTPDGKRIGALSQQVSREHCAVFTYLFIDDFALIVCCILNSIEILTASPNNLLQRVEYRIVALGQQNKL